MGVDAGAALSQHLPSDARAALGLGGRDDPVLQAERDGAIYVSSDITNAIYRLTPSAN